MDLASAKRILLIDEEPEVHQQFREIFGCPAGDDKSSPEPRKAVMKMRDGLSVLDAVEFDSVHAGSDGLEKQRSAAAQGRPYLMAIVSLDLKHGLGGVETIHYLWEYDPALFILVTSADHSRTHHQLARWLGRLDQFLILPRPVDGVQVRQLVALVLERRLGQEEIRNTTSKLHSARRMLDRANETAQAAEQAKNEFMANISHEIRTPMNAILGFSRMLMKEEFNSTQREKLQYVHDAGTALLRLINNVLDFSKLAAGELSIARASFDLDELVADLLETTRPLAENKGLLIQSHVQDNVPRSLVGDQVRVRQILANLIDNAVKFTEQGTIYLRITVDERSRDSVLLRMVVTDTGVGIPPERQAVIFDSFAQADGSSTRHHGGLGLGLTICKQLADLMEGQIGFRSNAGSGTSFWVTLSFGLSAQTEKRAAPVARRQVGSAGPASDDAPDAGGDADFGDTPKTGRRPVVLVAEDDHLNQTLLEVLLTRAGCIVDIVGSGNEALELCLQHTVDLVFMDVEMPGMDGLEAIRRIRQQQPDGASRLPIVALTAQAMPGDRERCLESGADEYLPKPFTPEDLFGAVERQLPGLLASNEWESGGETAPNQPNLDQNNRSALERTRAMRRALESENYRQLENHAKALRKLGQQLEGSEVADQAMRVQLAARSGDARRVAAAVGRLQQAVEAQTGAPTTAAPENT